MSYYNTTNEKGEALNKAWTKTDSQKNFIYELFVQCKALTASECWKLYPDSIDYQTPLTSIRRAMTDLTIEGKLIKTDIKKQGIYNRPEYVYSIKEQLKLF